MSAGKIKDTVIYEGVSKSFRTGRLERKLRMVQLSATKCSCIAILWVSLVSFAAITLCVASQWCFIAVSIYFVIDSVRKRLDTPSYVPKSFRTCRLERKLRMVQLSATRRSFIDIVWVSVVSFAAITLCVASQRVFIFVVYFVIESVRELSDIPSYY
jgi:hypothetical protein